MRIFFATVCTLISAQSMAGFYTDDRVFLENDKNEEVVCGVRGIGFLYGYEEELLECVQKNLKDGYRINKEKSTFDLEKLQSLLKEKMSEEKSLKENKS